MKAAIVEMALVKTIGWRLSANRDLCNSPAIFSNVLRGKVR